MATGGRRSSDPDIAAIEENVDGLSTDVGRLTTAVFHEEDGLVPSITRLKFAVFGMEGTDQKGLLGEIGAVKQVLTRIFLLGVAWTGSMLAGLIYLVLQGGHH